MGLDDIAEAIERALVSPNVLDSNFEAANIVDVVQRLATATGKVANAICPSGAVAAIDASGGHVASLTEACIGITAGLFAISASINSLADAVEAMSVNR